MVLGNRTKKATYVVSAMVATTALYVAGCQHDHNDAQDTYSPPQRYIPFAVHIEDLGAHFETSEPDEEELLEKRLFESYRRNPPE